MIDGIVIGTDHSLAALNYARLDGGQAVLAAPGEGEARLLLEAPLLQLLLDPRRLLVVFRQLQPLFQLLLLLLHEEVV